MIKIAIAEDDEYLRGEICETFNKNGYYSCCVTDFTDTQNTLLGFGADLIVLDVNLPGKSGFEICRYLKAHGSCPVLILTSRDTLGDELKSLALGADEFITKPCPPGRLIARAERLLKTYGKVKNIIECGSLTLDTDTYKLTSGNTRLVLPETEGKILRRLFEGYPGAVPYEELMLSVWGTDEFIDENILQVNITRLRKSLASIGAGGIIKTVRGKGYMLEAESL